MNAVNILIFKVLQRKLKIKCLNSEKEKKKELNAVFVSCWSCRNYQSYDFQAFD